MSAPAARRKAPVRPTKAKPKPARPQKRTTAAKAAPASPPGKPISYELAGIGLITLGALLLVTTQLPGDLSRLALDTLQWFAGTYGAWGISAACILLGVALLFHCSNLGISVSVLGMLLMFLSAIGMAQLTEDIPWNPQYFATSPGGLLGGIIGGGLERLFGPGAWVVLIGLALCGLALVTDIPLWMLLAAPFKLLYKGARALARPMLRRLRADRESRLAARVEALKAAELQRGHRSLAETSAEKSTPKLPILKLPKEEPEPAPTPTPVVIRERAAEAPSTPPAVGVPSKEKPGQLQFDDQAIAPKPSRPFSLPPLDMLSISPNKGGKPPKGDVEEKIQSLEQTLASFGIEAKVVAVERGPRVTRFEIVPPPGIRINRITNLADNIALSLAALDVRVEAPVPGKGVVGIEVPNKESVIVDLREIVESEVFQKAKSPLVFSLGRDIAGVPRVADLTRMPHLLIAGATNSGKSVCINTLLASILMRATPQQVKFLLVDPKRVELSLFQHIPHLLAPVAYDAKHAAGLLRWAIREMEQRYEMFAEKGVRNIVGFNEQSRLDGLEEVPYIVIIIDELADLMMQAAAEFESSICRLAQLARATGIHLVVATQRPSVNVITGTIKANIPSRIAFAVASQVDSRTILDMNGAERLVGQGDMLYLPVDASKPVRIQGAYISERDINHIVEHVKTQGKPSFSDEIVAIEEAAMRGDEGGEGPMNNDPEDELFEKALDFVRTTKYASTSMLQRKFRIGYTRAARLMDLFEERGYVGPGQGSKPREVIFAPTTAVTARPAAAIDDNEDDGIRDPFAEDEE